MEVLFYMNLKVRFNNPVFVFQLLLAIISPILLYYKLTVQDLTTWTAVWNLLAGALMNPYVLGTVLISVWNALNDPTTAGVTDSSQAMTYSKPRKG